MYPSYDGIYGDQSNTIRTVEYSIPTAYQNQANVYIRFVVDTDAWTNYGGNYPGDTQEGFTLEDIRVVDDSGIVLFRDDLDNQFSMNHYPVTFGTIVGYDDWSYYTLTGGVLEEIFGFEELEGYDQKRLYAFLAERYMSFWFRKYSKFKEHPWIFIDN